VRGLDELDGEQELDGADEKAAEVQRERDGAQRKRHLVQDDVLGRRQELELERRGRAKVICRTLHRFGINYSYLYVQIGNKLHAFFMIIQYHRNNG
jgi:hypothetical protein